MDRKIIKTENAPAAMGPYEQGVSAGSLVFVSGQLGIRPSTGEFEDGIEAQTSQCMKNIGAILSTQALSYGDIVKTTIFVRDLSSFETVNSVYVKYFSGQYPARSCVEVSRLPKDGLVEIEAIAIGS